MYYGAISDERLFESCLCRDDFTAPVREVPASNFVAGLWSAYVLAGCMLVGSGQASPGNFQPDRACTCSSLFLVPAKH